MCSFDFSKFTVVRNLTNILTVTNNSVSQDLCEETSKFSVGQDLCKDTTKFTVVRNRTNLHIVTKDLVSQNLCEDISKFTVVRNHCHKCFSLKSNLIVQDRSYHRDWPYKCSYCNKGFEDQRRDISVDNSPG